MSYEWAVAGAASVLTIGISTWAPWQLADPLRKTVLDLAAIRDALPDGPLRKRYDKQIVELSGQVLERLVTRRTWKWPAIRALIVVAQIAVVELILALLGTVAAYLFLVLSIITGAVVVWWLERRDDRLAEAQEDLWR